VAAASGWRATRLDPEHSLAAYMASASAGERTLPAEPPGLVEVPVRHRRGSPSGRDDVLRRIAPAAFVRAVRRYLLVRQGVCPRGDDFDDLGCARERGLVTRGYSA
jgi:hypothetical protein